MKAWIQRHNLESNDLEFEDVNEAIRFLKSFDWNKEYVMEEEADYETCPAGLGLVADDGTILHVCPHKDDLAMVHLHNYCRVRKIFGFIPFPMCKDETWISVPEKAVLEMINNFFCKRYDKILDWQNKSVEATPPRLDSFVGK